MKHFILLLLFGTILTSQIKAGIDSLYVEIKNDTVFVWSVNVWEQCAFELDYSIHFDDSFIFINQKDTAADATTCYSYHNFCMPIANLASGTYHFIAKVGEIQLCDILMEFNLKTITQL